MLSAISATDKESVLIVGAGGAIFKGDIDIVDGVKPINSLKSAHLFPNPLYDDFTL